MLDQGLAVFIRKPLSIDISSDPISHNPMLAQIDQMPFCPMLGNNEHVGTLPLNETEYYAHFSRVFLDGLEESTLKPGNKQSAGKLYPGAFGKKCCVTLSIQCQPELAMRVKHPGARPAMGGVMKPIEDCAMEEHIYYTAIAMSDSYFSKERYPNHRVFYKTPPIGCSVLGAGPMGMLFAVEWIGVVFFSIISEPFYAGSNKHKDALSMFNGFENVRDFGNPICIRRNTLFKTDDENKYGVAWGNTMKSL